MYTITGILALIGTVWIGFWLIACVWLMIGGFCYTITEAPRRLLRRTAHTLSR